MTCNYINSILKGNKILILQHTYKRFPLISVDNTVKTMNKLVNWESDINIDKLISDCDDTFMPLPDIECEPHLLISKVRKHYMEHMIKILSTNYETNQRLVNKNIYLPSAIWKCAKKLEMQAAQACMVVQLYRRNIVTMINEVKRDTKNGRLYRKLFESLHLEPQNEKRTQTKVTGDNTQCQCNEKKRRRKRSPTAETQNYGLKLDQNKNNSLMKKVEHLSLLLKENNNLTDHIQRIPVVTNMELDHMPILPSEAITITQPALDYIPQPTMTPKNTESDDLMQQLEAIFEGDKDDDDLFTSTLIEDNAKTVDGVNNTQDSMISTQDGTNNSIQDFGTQGSIIENHAAQIKSLDARLATLTGLLVNNEPPPVVQPQKVVQKKSRLTSKWLCEEFFLKKNLFELLYQISDSNRQKLARIKELYRRLFGEDSDDEGGVVSPADSPEFVASCKARIDAWVVTILAPHYAQGRIKGKPLYKAVAKHLIELIYKCKPYPSRHEVTSFVMDFLVNRGKIRCEADFKEFRIDNVHVVPNYTML